MLKSLTFILLLHVASVFGQANKPCGSEQHKKFDFWVGDWKVYDTLGNLIGTNNILKLQNNCVIQENWVSKKGPNNGTSYNYYNIADGTWNQVWIDNSGFSLVLKGNMEDGSMVLKSDLVKTENGNYYNRVSWTKNPDGSVTQVWTYMDEQKQVLKEAFRGIYKKQ